MAECTDVASRRPVDEPPHLQDSEIVLALKGDKLEQILETILSDLNGTETFIPWDGKHGVTLKVDIHWKVDPRHVECEVDSPHVQFHDLRIIVNPIVSVKIDFNEFYDYMHDNYKWLAPIPRCRTICWKRELKYPFKCKEHKHVCVWDASPQSGSTPKEVVFIAQAAGNYLPSICRNDEEQHYKVYPKLDAGIPNILDPSGNLEALLCLTLGEVLRKSKVKELEALNQWLCDKLARFVDKIFDKLRELNNDVAAVLFRNTNGYLALKLKAVDLYRFPTNRFPETEIPVRIDEPRIGITDCGSNDELQVRMFVHEP